MTDKKITCCIVGARERDLYHLGEIHKQGGVEILFVYDRDSSAVGLDIAEILGVPRMSAVADLEAAIKSGGLDYAVMTDSREMYESEAQILTGAGVKVIGRAEALNMMCGEVFDEEEPPVVEDDSESYSLEDALDAFERLFDRKKLLKFLLDVAVRATEASTGSIMLYSNKAQELYIAYATGLSERIIRNTRQKLGDGIAGMVARERKGRLITDAPTESFYGTDRERVDIRSAVSLPLVWEGRLLGVVNVSSDKTGRALDTTALEKMEKLSGRMAKVLHESVRLEETRVRHQELNLRKTVGELSGSLMATSVKFSMITNLLGELVGADTVEVFVGTDDGDWLVLGGSNRRLSRQPDLIRCGRGSLSRSFLDQETIVLTEPIDEQEGLASSLVFTPLHLVETLGVLMLEFGERHRLDEFLLIRDSVTLELSRFIAWERRERRLSRELTALNKVSESAPVLLTCHSVDELCEFLSRLVADTLECDRVSVRIQGEDSTGKLARFEGAGSRSETWAAEDEERFLKLKKKGEPFSLAFMDFGESTSDRAPAYHSMIASPIMIDDKFCGGVIAYDKRPDNAFEETTFSKLDAALLQQIVSITAPVLRNMGKLRSHKPADEISYDSIVADNLQRLKKIMETEMSRSDRYHNSFSLVVLKIKPLESMFEEQYERALGIVDDVTKGIQTRTRKTDFGSWIRRDTFAMVSLEGTRRIKFLISRLLLYLVKDFSALGSHALTTSDVLIGRSIYPGTAKTPEALLAEVEKNLRPHSEP